MPPLLDPPPAQQPSPPTNRPSLRRSPQVKTLLTLMGVPVVDAPCEAEATCAALAKAELVYATATEDMDALTFATPRLVSP